MGLPCNHTIADGYICNRLVGVVAAVVCCFAAPFVAVQRLSFEVVRDPTWYTIKLFARLSAVVLSESRMSVCKDLTTVVCWSDNNDSSNY